MSFAKTLLAGAAVCALCTAPALAAPSIHLAGADSLAKAHVKTNVIHRNATTLTETITFTGTLSTATFHKVPTLLWAETWQDTATCIPPANEKGSFKQTTAAAKVSNGSSTGATSACPSSTFTFYGPVYKLTAKHATSDSFSGTVIAKRYSGYNLTLNGNTDLTITP
jgi:hypothetical protein